MVEARLSRLSTAWAFVLFCSSLLMASCSTPEFQFVDTPPSQPPHCQNSRRDEGESDVDCGGACAPCGLTQLCNRSSDCRESQCISGTCQAASCSDGSQTGSETDVDCGGGACKPCPVDGACTTGSDCQTGVCSDRVCAPPSCGDRVANGDESDVDCGGPDCSSCVAGQSCVTPGDCVGNDCNAGKCALSCAAGLGNCDGDPTNGCETNLRTDADHCGDCATGCSLPNAKPSCAGGICRVESCVAPFDDCNGDPADGCEVNTKTNVDNCGACAAKPCPTLNGQAFCANSQCGITCADNFADCDGEGGNGCEKDVSRDVNNCGGCGKKCTASAGKTAWCRKGQCGETTCAAGRGDCNGDPDDDAAHGGCETDLKTDLDSCGACGTACGISGGVAQCSAGVCAIKSCSPGLADCTGGYADGCETNTNTDLGNCGTCGKTCTAPGGSPACVSGACQIKSCTGNNADCNGTVSDGCETNTSNNQTHCGACTGDSVNCNTLFPNASAQCVNSTCNLTSCATNYFDCDAVASNGCEVNLKTDKNHCGTCAIACSAAGASVSNCVAGTCAPTCTGTRIFCSNPQNGCPIESATDASNCGGCGKVCDGSAGAHVSSNSCVSSACKPMCQGLWADCDGNPGNGCERTVASDPANCGGCGVSCGTANASSTSCVSGTCTPVCAAGWKNCGAPQAGCNVQLGTVDNCRFCGEACTGANKYCTANGCVAHFDIGVVGAGLTAGSGFELSVIPTLTKNHTLTNSKASGRYRLVLVGVTATEPFLASVAPKYAWYNGVLMHAAIEVDSNEKQSYAGIFYLLDSELPTDPGSYPVKVQFTNDINKSNGTGAFTVTEFQNVQQTAGTFVTTVASPSDVDCSVQATRSVALSFTQAGSFGYALIAARAGMNAVAMPGAFVETMNVLQNQPYPLAGLAGYAGPINASTTLSWNVANCSNTAGVGVALKRVGD